MVRIPPLTPDLYLEANSKGEKNETIAGSLSRGLAGEAELMVVGFIFNPMFMQMFPGNDVTVEWRIIRRKK